MTIREIDIPESGFWRWRIEATLTPEPLQSPKVLETSIEQHRVTMTPGSLYSRSGVIREAHQVSVHASPHANSDKDEVYKQGDHRNCEECRRITYIGPQINKSPYRNRLRWSLE